MNSYLKNKALFNSIFWGIIYFILTWSIDFSKATKDVFAVFMLFLPGITFPASTCYIKFVQFQLKKALHFILSIVIYVACVWLFIAQLQVIAGFLGALLFLLSTNLLLYKHMSLKHLFLSAVLSGLVFIPIQFINNSGFTLGIALLLWTLINGYFINLENHKI